MSTRRQWQIALEVLRNSPTKVSFHADLKAAGVTDPARTVRELNRRRYRVEVDGSDWTDAQRGTRYVFYGRKRRITTDKNRPQVGGTTTHSVDCESDANASSPPSGSGAADLGPTFVEERAEFSLIRKPKWREPVEVNREDDRHPPAGPGRLVLVVHEKHLEALDQMLADGTLLPYEERKAERAVAA